MKQASAPAILQLVLTVDYSHAEVVLTFVVATVVGLNLGKQTGFHQRRVATLSGCASTLGWCLRSN